MRFASFLVPLSVLLAASGAASQSTIVSPVGATNVEGNSNNIYPFASTIVRRYQQIHGDIGGTPKLIQKLSFRADDGNPGNYTGTFAIDLEMFIGLGRPVHQTSYFYDVNYLGPRGTAIARKVINMGPQGQANAPGPNPFTPNMDLVLDSIFPYPGNTALVWEVVVYSNTGTGRFMPFDADASSSTSGIVTVLGAGCIATGQATAMVHQPIYVDRGGALLISYQLASGPANAPTLLAIGSGNPNLAVPGLCSNLHTNLILLVGVGVTDATGNIDSLTAAASTFVLPNTLGGASIYSQMHALDPGRPDAFKISNSDGRRGVVPMPNLTKLADVVRLWNDTGGTTALQAIVAPATTLGYGLVTQFTY